MAITLEIGYYNTFILSGGAERGDWHVEESRMRGGFNDKSVDFGVHAHMIDEEYTTRTRENALMHSGIYNSKTKTNNTNQFPIGQDITRSVDISNGSIQKLHAEDTDLTILQENKVMKAQIDKDIIYTAEGQPITTLSDVVIGNIRPILGKYGIGTNPESFASFGGRKYFADKNRGVVLRLSQDGLTPISMYGMKDFFRDNLQLATTIHGIYDEVKDIYILSMQGNIALKGGKSPLNGSVLTETTGHLTLGFSEKSTGWVSLYSYQPNFGISLTNKFYTFSRHDLYEHYHSGAYYNFWYEASRTHPSYVNVVMNDEPSVIKNFLTINYEGSADWSMDSARSRKNAEGYNFITEEAYKIPTFNVTILDENKLQLNVGFEEKENKFFKQLKRNYPTTNGEDMTGAFNDNAYYETTGLKGEYLDVTMLHYIPTAAVLPANLFSVSNEVALSSN